MKRGWVTFYFLLGVLCISFSPLAVKVVDFSATASAFYRSFYAALFLLVITGAQYKRELASREYRWLAPIAIGGVSLGIDLILWHKTIFYVGAGPATFLGNSQIIFVTIFAALVFKEKLTARYIGFVLLTLAGLYLLMPSVVNTVNRGAGFGIGMLVGLTYAIMLISMRYAKARSGAGYPEVFSLAAIFVFSTLVIGFDAVFIERVPLLGFSFKNHLLIAATAFLAQTLGWILIKTNITKLPAHEASLLLVLQPVLSTVWGRLAYHEPLSAVQLLGIALASGSIAAYLWQSSKTEVETCSVGETC